MTVTSRVPALKRTVERFVFSIKVFLTGAGGGGIKALLSVDTGRQNACCQTMPQREQRTARSAG